MKINKENIIKSIFFITIIIGIILTLYYIFVSSTAILTSDSVITDVLAHQQRINRQFILSHWYYGNEFWLFSLSIPTFLLSFIIKNNLLLRQISVLITAVIFFYLLYLYGKKFINKKGSIVLIAIFLTGISYSVLDYFYAFNAYLTVVINSLLTIYIFYLAYTTNNKRYYIIAIVLNLLLNISSLRYFPTVSLPLILTALIFIYFDKKLEKKERTKKIIKFSLILLFSLLGLGIFYLLTNIYHYEQRAGTQIIEKIDFKVLYTDLKAVVECINNFFGYDNKENPVVFLSGMQYFVSNYRQYGMFSLINFTNIIKIIMAIITMIITPLVLCCNYKKNDKAINFLLIYNILSWIFVIGGYIVTTRFFYNYSELKYFLLNVIINMILAVYCIIKYFSTKKITKTISIVFIITYILSNQYTTYLTLKDNNREEVAKEYELVNLLKKNDLEFGYGTYWNGLITNFFSNYEIEVVGIGYYSKIKPYRWYSDERWYEKDYYKGRIFLLFDETFIKNVDYYTNIYGRPDEILTCEGYYVYVYNKNVVAQKFDNYK